MKLDELEISDDRRRLILLIETNLHHLTKTVVSRDEAIVLKQIIAKPLGGLNSRFGLISSSSTLIEKLGGDKRKEIDKKS